MNKILIFLVIFWTQAACHKLSNAVNSAVLSCGPSLESGLWIKVHPSEGLTLPSDLKAVGLKSSSALPETLKITEKGCVQVDETHETVVVSSALTKFGAVYAKEQDDRDIILRNIGDVKSSRSCQPETYTHEKLIPLPLRLDDVADETLQKAFRVQVSIQEASQGKNVQFLLPIGLDKTLDLAALEDGRYVFDFLVSNYFSMVSEKHQCLVVVDHQKPEVEARYRSQHPKASEHVLLQPAENLFLDFEPGSEVSYCLYKEELVQSCEEFLPYESFIAVPDRGYWSLLYKARDKAGNESPTKRLRILAYDAKTLENIGLKTTLSSLYISEGKYTEALAEALDAEKKRLNLGSELEKSEALPKVQESLLNAMANIRLKYAPNIHRNRVLQIRMSDSLASSGYRIASVDYDHTVKILSPQGELLHDLKLHTDTIKAAEFIPQSFEIITGSSDGKLIFWGIDGEARAIASDHQAAINDVAVQQLSGDEGVLIASASADKTVRIWTQDGKALRTLQHDEAVTAVTIGPDGSVYSGDASGSLYFWAGDSTRLAKVDSEQAHSSAVYELFLAQAWDGSTSLLSAAHGEAFKIWTTHGSPVRTVEDTSYAGYPGWANGLHFTKDCQYLAIGSGSSVVLLDKTNFSEYGRFSVGEDVSAIAISNRCDRIAVGDGANALSIWTLKGQRLDNVMFPDYIYDLRFSSSDDDIIVGRQDNHFGIYAVNSLIRRLKADSSLVSMNGKGDVIVAGGANGLVDVWQAGKMQKSFVAHKDLISELQIEESGASLLTAKDKTAKIWETSTGEMLAKLDHDLTVTETLFLKNSPYIVTGSGKNPAAFGLDDAGEIHLWDRTGQRLASEGSFAKTVSRVEEHPSLNLIAVVEKNLHIYRVDAPGTLTKIAEFKGEFTSHVKWLKGEEGDPELVVSDSVNLSWLRLKKDRLDLVFSQKMETTIQNIEAVAGGSLIAVGDYNGNLSVLSRAGATVYQKNFGTNAMGSLAVDPKGTRLAFSIGSGKFAVLDVATGAIQTLNPLSSPIKSLQFTADGRLLSVDDSGSMRLWSFDQAQLRRDACRFISKALSMMPAYQDVCEIE